MTTRDTQMPPKTVMIPTAQAAAAYEQIRQIAVARGWWEDADEAGMYRRGEEGDVMVWATYEAGEPLRVIEYEDCGVIEAVQAPRSPVVPVVPVEAAAAPDAGTVPEALHAARLRIEKLEELVYELSQLAQVRGLYAVGMPWDVEREHLKAVAGLRAELGLY